MAWVECFCFCFDSFEIGDSFLWVPKQSRLEVDLLFVPVNGAVGGPEESHWWAGASTQLLNALQWC